MLYVYHHQASGIYILQHIDSYFRSRRQLGGGANPPPNLFETAYCPWPWPWLPCRRPKGFWFISFACISNLRCQAGYMVQTTSMIRQIQGTFGAHTWFREQLARIREHSRRESGNILGVIQVISLFGNFCQPWLDVGPLSQKNSRQPSRFHIPPSLRSRNWPSSWGAGGTSRRTCSWRCYNNELTP
jgi:hypothetical protein